MPTRQTLACLPILSAAAALLAGPSLASTIRVEPADRAMNESRAETLSSPETARSGVDRVCTEAVIDSIRYELCLTDSTFEFGDPVLLEYTITNERSTEAVFLFSSTCQEFLSIHPNPCPQGCEPIWPDPPGCFFLETELSFAPGETKLYTTTWRHHTPDGWPVRPGVYLARGELRENLVTRLELPFEIVPYGPQVIQEALDLAADGDTVLVAPGVYYENLLLLGETRDIVLRSEMGPDLTILDGGRRGSVLYVGRTSLESSVEGFTIRNGRESADSGIDVPLGGGMTIVSSVSVKGNRFLENESDFGGGLALSPPASPRLEDNLFLRNTAHEDGGGVFSAGNPTIERCTFARNTALRGAGIYDDGFSNHRVRALNSVFHENTASLEGGAIYCQDDNPPTGLYCNDYWANAPDDLASCWDAGYQLFLDPLFCAVDSDDYTLQTDSPLTEENSPCGRIGAFPEGCDPAGAPEAPRRAGDVSVQPNPFRHGLEVRSRRADGGIRRVEVVDAAGRRVWAWEEASAVTRLTWNGLDIGGRAVPAGVYFLRVWEAEEEPRTATLVRIP